MESLGDWPELHRTRHDNCQILSREQDGPGDVRLTVKLDDGTIRDIYADAMIMENVPRYGAVFKMATFLVWSDLYETDIEYVDWLTYQPADREIVIID